MFTVPVQYKLMQIWKTAEIILEKMTCVELEKNAEVHFYN